MSTKDANETWAADAIKIQGPRGAKKARCVACESPRARWRGPDIESMAVPIRRHIALEEHQEKLPAWQAIERIATELEHSFGGIPYRG